MSNFRVGDRVIRTSCFEQRPHLGWPSFEPDKVYTVSVVGKDGFLGLLELPRSDKAPYDPLLFRLASSGIQVGDYVKAYAASPVGFYNIGALAKVLAVDQNILHVRFTAGYWMRGSEYSDGTMIVAKGNFKKHTPYAATFTDRATVAAVAKGHVPDSGLQRHSVGAIYPLVVVTWANGDEPYKFTVENLEAGEQATVGGELMRFTDYATAYALAELLTFNKTVPVTWVKR